MSKNEPTTPRTVSAPARPPGTPLLESDSCGPIRKKLLASQRRYLQLFDEVPCYISVQDKDFHLVEVNRRFKENFGPARGFCFEVYKHRNEPCDNCPVAMTFEDGASHYSEEVVTSQDGRQYHVLVSTAALRDEAGEISHVMEMSTNITQIRKMQDHLTSLGLLIGSMSHGIKGLLTALDGGMYLLDTGFKKDKQERIKEGWEVVRLMVGRIKDMVLDILYYAKERHLEWEQVDVRALSEEVAATLGPRAEREEIELRVDIAEDLGSFEVDPVSLSSALVNILENAVEACVMDHIAKGYRVLFSVRRENGDVIFTIADNGLGMDQEAKENIFSLFFSSKGSSGTGLGTFIANQTVQQHGGNIQVESELGQGSVFTIRLPGKLPEAAKNGNFAI